MPKDDWCTCGVSSKGVIHVICHETKEVGYISTSTTEERELAREKDYRWTDHSRIVKDAPMAENKLKVGDTVVLPSRSPLMTVVFINENRLCSVGWFDGSDYKTAYIAEAALQKGGDEATERKRRWDSDHETS